MKISTLKKVFVGRPLATAQARHERLSKASALAVFASDALSSVAYATEEILLMLVLRAPRTGYVPIGVAICVLIAVVTSSYRQTIWPIRRVGRLHRHEGQPRTLPSLRRARRSSSYVLTVAVSVAVGITAHLRAPAATTIACCSASRIAAIATANLRASRLGALFALPTSSSELSGHARVRIRRWLFAGDAATARARARGGTR